MALYFFDTRDNGHFIRDHIGIELATVQAAKDQAAISLAELARDVLPGTVTRDLAVEVRNATQPILMTSLTFQVVVLLG